jgi:hypothetical protein
MMCVVFATTKDSQRTVETFERYREQGGKVDTKLLNLVLRSVAYMNGKSFNIIAYYNRLNTCNKVLESLGRAQAKT